MSNMCKRAIRSEHFRDLQLVSIDAIRKKLQSAITWTKNSGKGYRLCNESCVKAKLPPIKLYSPVKTRFGSVLMMMNQMWKYKDAIHFCYSSRDDMANSNRDPTNSERAVVRFIIRTMKPVLKACVLNQSGK